MYPCELQKRETVPTLTIRFHAPVNELAARFGEVYSAIERHLAALGEQPAGPAFATYYNMDMQNMDVEAGFPVSRPLPGKDKIDTGEIEGGTVVVCHYTGPYDGVSVAYDTLTRFVEERGYTPTGIAYEWYLNGPDLPPEELKTDVMFTVLETPENLSI